METGRYPGVGPSNEYYPLSAASASSPGILITATTATGGGTNVHTANAGTSAQDVLFVTIANCSAASLTAYVQSGNTATTASFPVSVSANTTQTLSNGNFAISNSGQFGVWTTASVGLVVTGYIARTFTSTGNF